MAVDVELIGLDTSVAVPLLVQTHQAHRLVHSWWGGRAVALSGHALVETYSVLTRLPGDVRLSPDDAAWLISVRFEPPILLSDAVGAGLPRKLASLGIAGGAVYDAIVGLASQARGVALATRDARARETYEAVGARVELVI